MGILKRAIAKDASVVASAVDATDIVAEIERIHKTSAVVTAALGDRKSTRLNSSHPSSSRMPSSA